MISYGKQLIDADDINAVVEVLKSDWLTQGPNVAKFENSVKSYVGVDYAIAVNSATSALHIAYLALGLGKGDIVWTVPNTFVATSNAALYCGADVDFIDIDLATFNICPIKLKDKLEQAKKNNCLPKIVTPVHFAGLSCDMEAISKLAEEYGFTIVEDASHAIGGKYKDTYVGSCKYSKITIFSFHPVKIITTAEGGMLTTNDAILANKILQLRSHGITRNIDEFEFPADGRWMYQQIDLGYNYRMPDINAILGYSQMQKLANFIERRNVIAKTYFDNFSELPLGLQDCSSDILNAHHLYVILCENQEQRKELDSYLLANGISCNVHYYPVYLQPFYRKLGFKSGYCPIAEDYYSRCLSIPMYAGLSDDEVRHISDLIISFYKK
ncbi:MAG: UDP-4-amino-4,6-dideoxy-N-acetyl-beta-L-altrosamine transaminase [Neisseriaceae bacterium]|nr:MAG: UDP-4-amino-4,6-dideoxy-N-acetyl-beta-L-altrosamine transaminase [Neisseriaceae bacterium]